MLHKPTASLGQPEWDWPAPLVAETSLPMCTAGHTQLLVRLRALQMSA